MEREARPRGHEEQANEVLEADAAETPATQFTARGPVPPVATDTTTRPPTASELAFGSSEHKQAAPETTGTKVAHPAPPPPDIDRKPQHPDVQRTAGWEQLARSHAHENGAPSEVKVPDSLVGAMDKAWKDSQSKPEQEQGGNIVRTYGGKYKLNRGKDHDGRSFDPDLHDVGWTETLVGIAHTHPYQDEGYEYGTFSDGDLANMVDEDQPLKMLRSGPYTFMISRTKEFDEICKHAEKTQTEDDLKKRITDVYNRAADATKGTFPEQLEAGVRAVCREFHLLYYEGKGSELHKVSGTQK